MRTFSPDVTQRIHAAFVQAANRREPLYREILPLLEDCTPPERVCLEFFYGQMPVSDLVNYPFSLYQSFARHGLMLWEESPWCQTMPEEIFFNDVLAYRVNNEALEDCRPLFYEQLQPWLSDWKSRTAPEEQTLEQAALEVNYWCFSQATYQLTDDRTVAPGTVLRCAYGRCGEESTFAVTALRSVGIPARQVYAPRWSHCDDNHAWVEVWTGDGWHYLGACEPEPCLDKGWFTAAASRAMLEHCRLFSCLTEGQELLGRDGVAAVCNRTAAYARTIPFTVSVTEKGRPLPGVRLRLQVLNYSDYYDIAVLETDENGRAGLTLGQGFLQVHAQKDGRFLIARLDTRRQQSLELDFAAAVREQSPCLEGEAFRAEPPQDHLPEPQPLTQQQKEEARRRFDDCAAARHRKEDSFLEEAGARERALALGLAPESEAFASAVQALSQCKGNLPELEAFLSGEDRELRAQMLASLTRKDMTDLKAAVLEEHLSLAKALWDGKDREQFVENVLCPRIQNEPLTSWRGPLREAFSPEEQAAFRQEPARLWQWITENIIADTAAEYENLITTPVALLRARTGSEPSRRVLFVAVCRALDIPARLDPEDQSPTYWDGEGFVRPWRTESGPELGTLVLPGPGTDWVYRSNWSLSALTDGEYQVLDLSGISWQEGRLQAALPAGDYRLLTANRLPNGAIAAREYRFSLKAGESLSLAISLEQVSLREMLEEIPLPDAPLWTLSGQETSLHRQIDGKRSILVWCEEAKEPTEHILNELADLHERYTQEVGSQLILLVRGPQALEDKTLSRVLPLLPEATVCREAFGPEMEAIARRMYQEPGKLPLVIATDDRQNALFAGSGYNVGLAELLLRIHALS